MEKELQKKQVYQKMGLDTNEIDTNISKLEEKLNKEGKKIGEIFSTNMTTTLKKKLTQDINDIASKAGAPKLKLDVALNMSVDELTKLKNNIKKEFGKGMPIPVIEQKDMEPKIAHMSREEQNSVLKKEDLEVADKFREKWDKLQDAAEYYKESVAEVQYAWADCWDSLRGHTETYINAVNELLDISWDEESNAFDWIAGISQGLADIVEQIPSVIAGFNAIAAAREALSATNVQSSNQEAQAATMATGAEAGKALMGATSSGASIGFPQNLIAIAAGVAAVLGVVAMVASTISKAKKHAAGGIIEGSRTVGDNILARVNAGEMILNKRQQSHLFGMLDKGTMERNSAPSELSFRIKGEDLVGAIKNYNNKHR